MSLGLVVVGLALTATFFVGSPFTEAVPASERAVTYRVEPAVPAITPTPNRKAERDEPVDPEQQEKRRERRAAIEVPKDKTLRVTVPAMKRVEDATFPYAVGSDEDAFKDNAGVHLRGTGFPWQRVANVYMAGHRLGYVGTPSFLAFWDLNQVKNGDKVFVTDAAGRRYVYKVFKEFIVDPEDVYVTQPLKGRNVLTLQTCTLPDYSRRLIIQAELVETPVPPVSGEGKV